MLSNAPLSLISPIGWKGRKKTKRERKTKRKRKTERKYRDEKQNRTLNRRVRGVLIG
jgi:hypothetical protein